MLNDFLPLILDRGNDFFPQPISMKQFCEINFFGKGLSKGLCCFKETNSHMFWLLINTQQGNDKSKYIMCFLRHPQIKIVIAKIAIR
jgi:hypothetical protein